MLLAHRGAVGAVCLVAVTLVACSRTGDRSPEGGAAAEGDRVGTANVTGAELRVLSDELALDRIVAARCLRETACNNVGPDKHFATYEACSRTLRFEARALGPRECPRGAAAEKLDACLDAVRHESCNDLIDTLLRVAACRVSELCPDGG
jgi:hypothetical protein